MLIEPCLTSSCSVSQRICLLGGGGGSESGWLIEQEKVKGVIFQLLLAHKAHSLRGCVFLKQLGWFAASSQSDVEAQLQHTHTLRWCWWESWSRSPTDAPVDPTNLWITPSCAHYELLALVVSTGVHMHSWRTLFVYCGFSWDFPQLAVLSEKIKNINGIYIFWWGLKR